MIDQPPSQASRPWWALAVAIVALAAASWLLITDQGTGPADPEATDQASAMLAVAPGGTVELASLPAVQQELYQAAAADPDGFEAVTCYCGCEAFLDHPISWTASCALTAAGSATPPAAACAWPKPAT